MIIPLSLSLAMAAPALAPAPLLTLQLEHVSLRYADDQMTVISCLARWDNQTGGPLTGESAFGGILDGLTLVVADGEGDEVVRQLVVYHQSPVYHAHPVVLPEGESRATVSIPLEGIAPHQLAQVRLEGGLIGHPRYETGFVTDWAPLDVFR